MSPLSERLQNWLLLGPPAAPGNDCLKVHSSRRRWGPSEWLVTLWDWPGRKVHLRCHLPEVLWCQVETGWWQRNSHVSSAVWSLRVAAYHCPTTVSAWGRSHLELLLETARSQRESWWYAPVQSEWHLVALGRPTSCRRVHKSWLHFHLWHPAHALAGGSSAWAPTIPVRDTNWILGSWLQPGPSSGCCWLLEYEWGVDCVCHLSVSVCVFLPSK